MNQRRLEDYSSSKDFSEIFEIPLEDSYYPTLLKNIKKPPETLYARGNIELLKKPSIAIVGTRKPSAEGEYYSKKITEFFVKNGFVIVSGLAVGVDSIVAKTALDSDGYIINVLPSPVDVIIPKKTIFLQRKPLKNVVFLFLK
ncbi:DNA-processing protein DprA [Methanothermobacter sp.]|uniref:DNA-processing protein DprA n=1 Tax=Methanothermobacter sp. TaxID=1884223 RepID=UPI002606F551|nr:DNA-processing protein DprA [Methanothermobacter sp.]MDI9617686.1 DNA-processing protein DprA [Methanothermobacter sp.]